MALIEPESRARAVLRGPPGRGYLDLLGGSDAAAASTGLAQDLMVSRLVPRIYERWWRPALGRVAKGPLGPGMADELRIARRLLAVSPGDGVLDVACGTGRFSRDLARSVGPAGLVVGIDLSETMLDRAVREPEEVGRPPQVAYIRGDAQELPFRDRSFDAVCCFAALNLMSDPMRALDRMAAVLTPGGRIALFTSAKARSTPFRALESAIAAPGGIRMFERDELTAALADRGFVDIRRRLTGLTQFVGARLPA